jgi:hypothetical protein
MAIGSITRLVQPDDVVTVLREPRARVLSHQLFWSTLPDAVTDEYGEYQVHRVAFDGLRRFLESPEAAHQSDNLIVRMLAGVDLDASRALSDIERREAAASALDTIGSLGCTTFVESPTFWADLSGFVGMSGDEVRENVTGSGESLPPFDGPQFDREALELLDERTAADRVVYRAVVARRLGIDEAAADVFADRQFLAQVERYCRVVARAESSRRTLVAPSPAASPSSPVPHHPARVRTGLGVVARRLLRTGRRR